MRNPLLDLADAQAALRWYREWCPTSIESIPLELRKAFEDAKAVPKASDEANRAAFEGEITATQDNAHGVSHQPTMNLRFIEREVAVLKTPLSEMWTYKKVRILQQMFVPKDWSTGLNEYWQDVPFVAGDFSNTQSLRTADKHDEANTE